MKSCTEQEVERSGEAGENAVANDVDHDLSMGPLRTSAEADVFKHV